LPRRSFPLEAAGVCADFLYEKKKKKKRGKNLERSA
jgi:hypothetical protein